MALHIYAILLAPNARPAASIIGIGIVHSSFIHRQGNGMAGRRAVPRRDV
jgi:hypothetical protein